MGYTMIGKRRSASDGVSGRNRGVIPQQGGMKKHTPMRSERTDVCFGFRVNVEGSSGKGGELVGTALGLQVPFGKDLLGAFPPGTVHEPPGITLCGDGAGMAQFGLQFIFGHTRIEIQTGADVSEIVAADVRNAGDGADVALHQL